MGNGCLKLIKSYPWWCNTGERVYSKVQYMRRGVHNLPFIIDQFQIIIQLIKAINIINQYNIKIRKSFHPVRL